MMKATLVSTNSLRYLKDVLEEVRDNGDSLEVPDALEMIQGFITEATIIAEATLSEMLERNENLIRQHQESEDA